MRTAILIFGIACLLGCSKSQPTATNQSSTDWKARVKTARDAFPAEALPSCSKVDGNVLVLSGGGKTRLDFCRSSFGDDEMLFDYRPSDSLDWRGKKLDTMKKIALFAPSKQVAPNTGAAGAGRTGSLTPGILEGRAVVFSVEGKPECEVAVHEEGPQSAVSNSSESVETIANKGLCTQTSAAIRKALSSK